MNRLSYNDSQLLLKDFPQIKLSYDNHVHKKVLHSEYELITAVPVGKRCFAWFTLFRDQPACIVLETDKSLQIKDVQQATTCFASSLCLGTILHGTLFCHMNHSFFSMEDILYLKGMDVRRDSWFTKLSHMQELLQKDIVQTFYNTHFLVFGLPLMASSEEEMERKKQRVSYPLHQQVLSPVAPLVPLVPLVPVAPAPKLMEQAITSYTILLFKPDIENDVYHIYADNNDYLGVASIPDYQTSMMMNAMFRDIKENRDLDALEESDDEDEFENPNIDKFVYLERSHKFECRYNKRHHKWYPVKLANANAVLPTKRNVEHFVQHLLNKRVKM